MKREVVLDVFGTPAPKGSGRAMLIAGKARHVPSGSDANRAALKSWDVAVRDAAREAIEAGAQMFVGVALHVEIAFRLRRPAGHYNRRTGQLRPTAPRYPISKPDLSKLVRATEDSLTGIVWDDDSRVSLLMVAKDYADPGYEGARIVVRERGL